MSDTQNGAPSREKKAKKDGARAKVFTKISREIIVAIKEGGGDPNNNAKLATLIQKAKSNNIPNDNIDRLIKKAVGGGERTITKTAYMRATVLTVLPLSLIALPTTETEQQAKSVTTLTSSAAIWVQAAVYRSCST